VSSPISSFGARAGFLAIAASFGFLPRGRSLAGWIEYGN
jgi:hypothetical protein